MLGDHHVPVGFCFDLCVSCLKLVELFICFIVAVVFENFRCDVWCQGTS